MIMGTESGKIKELRVNIITALLEDSKFFRMLEEYPGPS
jgi:hypothetical protein